MTLYMPMIPQLAMTMLACARLGAVHSVIFAGFSAEAIADRIADARSKWVVTASAGKRGGRVIPLKAIVDDAVAKERCAGIVERVLVFDGRGEGGDQLEAGAKDVRFTALVAAQRPVCACEWMDAEDPLFILYTSGSTGRPKGETTREAACEGGLLVWTRRLPASRGRSPQRVRAGWGWVPLHSSHVIVVWTSMCMHGYLAAIC